MGKRFIDTNLFDDSWFMDLPKDAKILWLFLITKCDHAGIIEINERLCVFQTGIKSLDSVIEQLGNRIIKVKNHIYFIPKFLEFQYPSFPNSSVKQQESAIKILEKYGLFSNGCLTLNEPLDKSYEYENEYGNEPVSGNEKEKKKKYGEYKHVLLTDKEYQKLLADFGPNLDDLIRQLDEGIELKGYKYKNHNLALRKWAKNGINKKNCQQKSITGIREFTEADEQEMRDLGLTVG